MQNLQKLVSSKLWNHFITAVILLNSIILGLDTSIFMRQNYGTILTLIDKICLWIFVIEIIFRILAYNYKFFIGKDWGWNVFDFLIVVISLLEGAGISILRAFRIFRALRLLSILPSMRLISTAMLRCLPSMTSICVLLLIFYYVYGVMCVSLFGEKFPQWFGDLGASFYTLFQIMTLEGWSDGIVRPVMAVYPYAWIVFVSFILIVSFVVLNLVIGVVVESIAELKKDIKNKNS